MKTEMEKEKEKEEVEEYYERCQREDEEIGGNLNWQDDWWEIYPVWKYSN